MMVEMHNLSVSQSHEQDPLQCHKCSKAETQTEHFGAERFFDFVVGKLKKHESWMRPAPRLERRAGCWAVTTRLRLGFLSAAGLVKASSRERRCEGREDIMTN
jgi:hypothetical protein